MSIIHLQRRISEVGRLRIGQQVAAANGKKRPAKLETWRITSPDQQRIVNLARMYGGQPREWEAPSGAQWEVVTETDRLPVIVPPSDMAFSQHMELWAAGGCQRRCNGQFESISDGPCLCNPDTPECGVHTRLSVMLRDLPGLGVFRLDTQGWYAAQELQGAVGVIALASGRGQMLPATLRLEQRMVKRQGETVKRFAVPVLDVEVSPAQLLAAGGAVGVDGTPGTLAIEPPRQQAIDGSAPLTPVPESVPSEPVASVAVQAAAPKERKRRSNAAQPIPATGVKPRTAKQAAAARQEEPPPPPEPPPAEDDDPLRLNRRMHVLFRKADCPDREDRLIVTRAIVRRENIVSSEDLSRDEVQNVVDTLGGWERDGVLGERITDILQAWAAAQTDEEPEQQDEAQA